MRAEYEESNLRLQSFVPLPPLIPWLFFPLLFSFAMSTKLDPHQVALEIFCHSGHLPAPLLLLPLFFLPLGFSFFSLSILPLVQTLHFLIVIGLRLLVQEFLLLLGAFRSLEPLVLRRLSPLR